MNPNSVYGMLEGLNQHTPEVAVENVERIADALETDESIREQLLRDLRMRNLSIIDKLTADLGKNIKHPGTGKSVRLGDLPAVRRQIERIVTAMGLDVNKKVESEGVISGLLEIPAAMGRGHVYGDPTKWEVPAPMTSEETQARRAKDWQDIQNRIYSNPNYFRAGP